LQTLLNAQSHRIEIYFGRMCAKIIKCWVRNPIE
jgi:hypothetical protein